MGIKISHHYDVWKRYLVKKGNAMFTVATFLMIVFFVFPIATLMLLSNAVAKAWWKDNKETDE